MCVCSGINRFGLEDDDNGDIGEYIFHCYFLYTTHITIYANIQEMCSIHFCFASVRFHQYPEFFFVFRSIFPDCRYTYDTLTGANWNTGKTKYID